VVAGLFVAPVRKLKTSLVDRRRIENRRFRHLDILVYGERVKAAFRKIEPADALVVRTKTVVVVANDERVVLIDRVIKTRTQEQIAPRDQERLTEVNHVEIVVEHARADEFVIVGFNASEVEEE